MVIKNIIFDLGGVFINLDNKLTEQAFVKMGVKNFAEYFGHGFAASFFKDYEVGKINDAEFIGHLREMGKLKSSDQEIIDAWNALLLDFPPERIEFLNGLKNDYRLFLFSNTNALHYEKVREIYTRTFGGGELDDNFEKAYYSHILHLRKPDPESFLRITGENGLTPSETLFVDDALLNVEGADAAGLQGYFLSPGKTVLDMQL